MAGSATFESAPIKLSRRGTVAVAARYADGVYTLLPHVQPLMVEESEGDEPGTAQFRYVLKNDGGNPDIPSRFDDVYPLDAVGDFVLVADDEVAVIEYDEAGKPRLVFVGYAQIPQLDISGRSHEVTFQALGSPVRCWDDKLGGAIYRSAKTPDDPESDVRTGLPARFNPDGKPNCVASDELSGADGAKHRVFVDERVVRDPEVRKLWSISEAAAYILATGNPLEDDDGNEVDQVVENPDFDMLEALLDSRRPKSTGQPIDMGDPSTYESSPIVCQDLDVFGKPWPEALRQLLEPHGFGMAFRLEEDEPAEEGLPGAPYRYLEIYRKDDAGDGTLKSLRYQASGDLDPAKTDLGAASLVRSASDLANEIEVNTAPDEVEITVVLAPGYSISGGDASSLDNFVTDNANFPANASKYRDYVFGEAGDGHWAYGSASFVTDVPSLDAIFGEGEYACRRRPALSSELFSKPGAGQQTHRARLDISTNYAGPVPGVWDGTGTWQQVTGGWKPLEDRLGIRLTVKDVERSWNIGASKETGVPFPSGKVRGVTCQAAPNASQSVPRFYLRLTARIQADFGIDAVAEKRPWSPTQYTIRHVDEARDRFQREIVAAKSLYNSGTEPRYERDDTDAAVAHAEARRAAHEFGPVAGSVTIPRMTFAFRIGDRVEAIEGREPDVSLGVNTGDEGESQVYPSVVKITRTYGSSQGVTLHLSDRRAEPAPRRRG